MTKTFTSPARKWESGNTTLDSRLRGNDGWKKQVLVVGFVIAAIALAGCGKRGAPQPPPGVPNTYPQAYPAQ